MQHFDNSKKRGICYIILFITVICSIFPVAAQNAETVLARQVQNIRAGVKADRSAFDRLVEKEPGALLQSASAYRNDTIVEVRRLVYSLYRSILKGQAKSSGIKKETVEKLVKGTEDTDSYVRQLCTDCLTECNTEDFTETAKNTFCNIFNRRDRFSKDFILLAGFVGNPQCKTTLEYLAYNPAPDHKKFNWAAYIALARTGDQNAVNWCLSRINSIKMNDDVADLLLPDLIYTRQYRIYEYLISVLNSDEELCFSSNPDYEKPIICGYKVMEYFAPVIRKYPLSLLPSGDINTKDYHKALLSVREWFAKQNGKYEIITTSF